jgi:protein gp37
MADGSAIEWTDATWNPVTGCTKLSAGKAVSGLAQKQTFGAHVRFTFGVSQTTRLLGAVSSS